MKKPLLTILLALILVLSAVLIYHSLSDKDADVDQMVEGEDVSLAEVSSEIDDVLLDEDNEIEIGEMI